MNRFSLPEIPARRDSVSDSIVTLIMDYLLKKQLKPGDKLPTEMEFVEMLKVGRNSVREAIKVLSSLGAVEIRRGVGTFVSEKCSASMFNPLILGLIFEQGTSKELGELRFSFEAGLMQIVMKKLTDDDIASLERANERIKEAAQQEADNRDLILELDKDFHKLLIGISRNKLILKIGEIVYLLYRESVSKKQTSATDPMKTYRNHALIIDELRKKDIDSLLDLIGKFIDKDIGR